MRDVMVAIQKGDHSLGYYDFATGAELGRTPVDPFPHEFVLSHDRRLAYASHFGVALAEDEGPGGNTISIVDLAAQCRVGTIHCGAWRRPHGIAFDGRGKLYVVSEGTSTLLVFDDPVSARPSVTLPTGGKGSHMVAVTADGTKAFCSNMGSGTVTVIFPGDPDRTAMVVPVGQRPEGSVLDVDERHIYVVNRESAGISVIDVHTLMLVGTIATPSGPVRICLDDAGALLVSLYHRKAIGRFDPDGTCRALVDLPGAPISIAFHASSRTVLASLHGDVVVLVDLDSFRVRATVATRSDPDPLAVVPLAL